MFEGRRVWGKVSKQEKNGGKMRNPLRPAVPARPILGNAEGRRGGGDGKATGKTILGKRPQGKSFTVAPRCF